MFLVAGYDTSSTALAWFTYYMSKHPRVQRKIKEELMHAYGDKRFLSLNRLESLVYLNAVIHETLRMLTVDDRLPESGAQLYKGDQVYILVPNLSRDPQHWSADPDRFYPQRFLKEDKSHHPYALIPFGGGHRQCMGQDLARFELKVIMATLMQHVTFGDGGSQINAGGYMAKFCIIPKHIGVTIAFD